MRLVQFRRHLDGYVVRVSDRKDISTLRKNKSFIEIFVLKELKDKKFKILSVEFFSKPDTVASIESWKQHVWKLLKYRKFSRTYHD